MPIEDGVRITWLGHATFLVTGPRGTTVLVDPFVTSNPACPEELHALPSLDAIAVTHGHMDHVADVVSAYEQGNPASVVAIVETAAWIRAQGVPADHVLEMNKGGTVRIGEVAITMVDANHSAGIPADDGMICCGDPAGLVLSFDDGACVYHAGDTNVFLDMQLIGELYRPDIALLPIGGHYTMGPREAAKACELLGVARVVPMHYGTWPVLTGTPDELSAECAGRGLPVQIAEMSPGQTLE